jgi:hypothetical protein
MSDEELRELERKQQSDPSIENATRLVHARARSGQATQQLYIVISIGYQYNDNYYYGGEDGGHPVRAFISEAAAEAHALQANIDDMLAIDNLEEWVHDGDPFIDISTEPDEDYDQALAAFYANYGLTFDTNIDPTAAENLVFEQIQQMAADGRLSREQLGELYTQSSLHFYSVAAVNLEDGYCA